jgi:hypothetical protein
VAKLEGGSQHRAWGNPHPSSAKAPPKLRYPPRMGEGDRLLAHQLRNDRIDRAWPTDPFAADGAAPRAICIVAQQRRKRL